MARSNNLSSNTALCSPGPMRGENVGLERQAQSSGTNERRDCGDWGPLIQVELDKDLFQAIALIAKYWRL